MQKFNKITNSGFTLIEILMAVLVISILAVVGVTQFQNFSTDAKNAATQSNLAVLRNAIATMNALEISRCQKTSSNYPALVTLNGNDITTTGGQCDIASLLNPSTGVVYTSAAYLTLLPLGIRPFVQNQIPNNPWSVASGNTKANAVIQSTVASNLCTDLGNAQTATVGEVCGAHTAYTGVGGAAVVEAGWCYCVTSGAIAANSGSNDGLSDGAGTESEF